MPTAINVLGVDLDQNTSTNEKGHTVGQTKVQTDDGGEYLFVQCDSTSAITQYDCVAIDENGKALPMTKARADDGFKVGFAQTALTAAYYGWVALSGQGIQCRLGAACMADVALYTSGTAGVLDDASTSQTKIDGVVAVNTNSTSVVGAQEIIATWPKSTTF